MSKYVSSITTTCRQFFQRRPVLTGSTLVITGITTYAFITEYRATQQLDEWKKLQTQQQQQQKQHEHLVDIHNDNDNNNNSTVQTKTPPPLLPRKYDWDEIHEYWSNRPVSSFYRLLQIGYELIPIGVIYIKDFHLPRFGTDKEDTSTYQINKQRELAIQLRTALTRLGPAFVKGGQQLSIRPDLISAVVLKELQKLCDSVEPINDSIALCILYEQLNIKNSNELFTSTPQRVAAASLGQVYKATIKDTNQNVAIKVQRPGMLESFSLDLYLLQHIGIIVDIITGIVTNQPPFHRQLYETFASSSYSELDYENEASNQIEFQYELRKRNCPVIVPNVYIDLTTQYVITTEWIDGIKLADAPVHQLRELIPVGVELFLTQLLDIGKFHSDPHPGNLLVNTKGQLCLIDFGLCANVDERARNAMTKAIVHLITKDFDTLIGTDAKELGFLPDDFDTSELKPILTKILTVGLVEGGSNIRNRSRKLMEISNELNEVFFRYPFSVPPFFALVTRGLGLLEGIALSGDPNFDIFQASTPYARRRAMMLLRRDTFLHSVTTRRNTRAT